MSYLISENEQAIFDHVVVKLAEQGCASVGPLGTCQYTDPEGRHCAAGWCLNEAGLAIVAEKEKLGGSSSILTFPEIVEGLSRPVKNLISDLQYVHDNAPSRGEWRSEMRVLAKKRGLGTEILEEKLTDEWIKGAWCPEEDY